MSAESHQDLVYLSPTVIRVAPEFNPRKVFKDSEIAEFAERLRKSKWISALLVRPDPDGDGYLLVAGERRLRASLLLKLDLVPVTIKEMDDVEHRKLALAENADRKELSVAEEALAARDHVDAYGGDHEQAAASLGWGVKRLRHRLQLLHATPAVIEALMQEAIQLGHAELLSTLPAENQAKALPRIIESGATIAELREQLKGFASPLEGAIFDKGDCRHCVHNSEVQQGLFAEHIGGGRCTNKECFGAKTTAAVHAKREALRDDFGTVVLLSEKVPDTTTPLIIHGSSGVGEGQYAACRNCESFGATINDSPGKAVGEVASPICFNLRCHAGKNEAYREMLGTGAGQGSGNDVSDGTGKAAIHSDSEKAPVTPDGKAQSATAKPAAVTAKPAQARSISKSVITAYAGAMRSAAIATIHQDRHVSRAMSVYALLRTAAGECPTRDLGKVCQHVGLSYNSRDEVSRRKYSKLVLTLLEKTEAELVELAQQLTLLMFEDGSDENGFGQDLNRRGLSASLVKRAGADIAQFLTVNEPFLQAHTRAGIETVLEESGFKAWCLKQDDGQKRYNAMLASGKGKLIEQVLSAGYNFAGYVPRALGPERASWEQLKTT